ncbi:MAG: hypothetical protein WD851_18000 [Pirellulales bacterium]
MIYEFLESESALRQGDIFRNIPFAELSLSQIPIMDGDEPGITTWDDLVAAGESRPITALIAIQPVYAMVLTQDCDAARGRHICLAQVDQFLDVRGIRNAAPQTPKKWQSLLTSHMRENLRYFYLPADSSFGFNERMAVDLRVIIRVPRNDLMGLLHHRLGRLNQVAYEHFRENLAQFFRRYPYNEWYPLNKEEAEAYAEASPESVDLYSWQK